VYILALGQRNIFIYEKNKIQFINTEENNVLLASLMDEMRVIYSKYQILIEDNFHVE